MAATPKKKVTFATDWTDAAGKEHKGGDTVSVDAAVARMLVQVGRARLAEETTPADAVDLTPKTETKAGK